MAETPSTMLPLGTIAPSFNLLDTVSNKILSLDQLKSDVATVIMFICNHCPYVIHIREKLTEIAKHYQNKGIHFIAICSNDVEHYPADSPANMKSTAEQWHFTFPYLYDETQEIAKAYHAACTPDFYVFDQDLKCVYRGRFDESTPRNGKKITGNDLSFALEAILNHEKINPEQQASLGCNIKWKR